MAKRTAEDVENGAQAYLKRQKITSTQNAEPLSKPEPPPIEIRSVRQLRQLLSFDQDIKRSRHGIQSFKTFLETSREDGNAHHIPILREYLQACKAVEEDDKPTTYLPELMQAWSFAAQSNDELLLSAIPAVLAVLLRTLSNILDMSQDGLGICRTILQKTQLELIARGLTVPKGKAFIISPALRLLKEISTFDGGSMAKQVFRARDYSLKSLARNLHLRAIGEEVEDRKKPSARTNAVRFLLSLVKFLPTESKRELLHQRDILMALMKDIKDDPPFVVYEILETLKTHVFQDEKLPRDAKAKIVNAGSLSKFAMLYGYDQTDEELVKANKSVESIAHEFLLLACTDSELGALNRQTGFYPRGIDPDDIEDFKDDQALLDLGLESIEWMEKFTEKVPVRNTILSEFIQTLRPWSSEKQCELLLSIFAAAPELVAEYFFGKKSFSFEPKLTATWIGYAAMLFSTLQLPIPKYFGHQQRYARLPPPQSIVLENVLPQALSQKVLRSCLLDPKKLITFFAIRLLCAALQKFQTVLKMYREAGAGTASLWGQAAASLSDVFSRRCPSIKDIIHAYRKMSENDLLQREAATRLLILYYEVVPNIALDAKFDVSGVLVQRLRDIERLGLSPEARVLCAMELGNLFQFAHFSPGMKWFSKTEGLSISPYMAMLKLAAEVPEDIPLLKLNTIIASVSEENQIFQTQTCISALDSFILVLRSLQGALHKSRVYEFLDDCCSRCAAKPMKYIFGLEETSSKVNGADNKQFPFSLLILAIQEQWPFLVKATDDSVLEAIGRFVSQYLATLLKIKEDKKIIYSVLQDLAAALPQGSSTRGIIEETQNLVENLPVPERKAKEVANSEADINNTDPKLNDTTLNVTMLEDDDTRLEDNGALVIWVNKDIEEAIEDGHAGALIILLSSEILSVRKEAVTSIQKFAAKLKDSTFEEKDQIWLLLSELVETARNNIDERPLPTIISAFASHAVPVLSNPLHHLYPKINKFLSQGPTWEIDKIPLMYKILDEPPSVDDAYYQEMSWLMAYMLAGLRTPADMTIFRKRRVFEKLLSIWNNTYLTSGLRDKILRLLYRATTIEGGSGTLITRFSAVTWLQAQISLGTGMSLKSLVEQILNTSDTNRVKEWSKGVKISSVQAEIMKFK